MMSKLEGKEWNKKDEKTLQASLSFSENIGGMGVALLD